MKFKVVLRDERVTDDRTMGFSRFGKMCDVRKRFMREEKRIPRIANAWLSINRYEITGFVVIDAENETGAIDIANSIICDEDKRRKHCGDLRETAKVVCCEPATSSDVDKYVMHLSTQWLG